MDNGHNTYGARMTIYKRLDKQLLDIIELIELIGCNYEFY